MAIILKYISEKGDSFREILKIIKKSKHQICYISLDKSVGALKEAFKKEKIDVNRFYFIDCISSIIKIAKKVKNCDFISSPYELKQIAGSIRKAISKGYTMVIFDSLSRLLVYGIMVPAGVNILIDFIKSFSAELEAKKGDSILICSPEDKNKAVIEETLPIFDKITGG